HDISSVAPSAARTRHRRQLYSAALSAAKSRFREVDHSPEPTSPPAGEEAPQQIPALLGPHSRGHLGMVEGGTVAQQIPHRADGTGFVVEGPEDDPSDAGADGRSRTHRAGLEGDHERAVIQAPPARGLRGDRDRHEFGMAERIAVDLPSVVTAADHGPAPIDDHGTDGHVVMGRGQGRLGEGESHPFRVPCPARARTGDQRAASSWSAKPTASPTWATTRAGSDRCASTWSMSTAAATPRSA